MSFARRLGKSVFAAFDRTLSSPQGPRILIYHRVVEDPSLQMEVSTRDFITQMEWLAANRTVVDLETAIDRWADDGSEQLTVLTFDDGYADVYFTAFPILERLGLPFLLYVSSGSIGGGGSSGDASSMPLTWSQIDEMLRSGLLTVGAHTHSHPDLRQLDEDAVEAELVASDEMILEHVGVRPRDFAYPYGFWAETADPVVRRRYDTAVLGGSPSPSPRPDVHLLHRYPVQWSDGFTFFEKRLQGGFRIEEAVRKRLKGYRGP